MQASYGSYNHPSHLTHVSSGWSKELDEIGNPRSKIKTVNIRGELRASGDIALNTLMNEIEAAYDIQGQDFVLKLTDGTPSNHTIISAETSGGTKVLNFQFTGDEPSQYATRRSYTITLQGTYLIQGGLIGAIGNIISYEDRLSFTGNGGPDYVLIPLLDGTFDEQTIYPVTPVIAVQSGSAVGRTRYPDPPPYAFPANRLNNRSEVLEYDNPRMIGPGVFTDFAVRWSRTFTLAENYRGVTPRNVGGY